MASSLCFWAPAAASDLASFLQLPISEVALSMRAVSGCLCGDFAWEKK